MFETTIESLISISEAMAKSSPISREEAEKYSVQLSAILQPIIPDLISLTSQINSIDKQFKIDINSELSATIFTTSDETLAMEDSNDFRLMFSTGHGEDFTHYGFVYGNSQMDFEDTEKFLIIFPNDDDPTHDGLPSISPRLIMFFVLLKAVDSQLSTVPPEVRP